LVDFSYINFFFPRFAGHFLYINARFAALFTYFLGRSWFLIAHVNPDFRADGIRRVLGADQTDFRPDRFFHSPIGAI